MTKNKRTKHIFLGLAALVCSATVLGVIAANNIKTNIFNATQNEISETITFSRATSEDFKYIGSGYRYSSKKTTSSGTSMYVYGNYVDKLDDLDTTTLFYLNYSSATISVSSTQNSINEFEFQSISKLKLTSSDPGLYCTVSYSLDGESFTDEAIEQAFRNYKTLEFEGAKLVRIKYLKDPSSNGTHISKIDITYSCVR